MQTSIGSSRYRRVQMMRIPPKNLSTDFGNTYGTKVSRLNRLADSTQIPTSARTIGGTTKSNHHNDDLTNQDYAAQLLLQMHRIATNEVNSNNNSIIPVVSSGSTSTNVLVPTKLIPQQATTTTVHPISPLHGPKLMNEKVATIPPRRSHHHHHRHDSTENGATISVTLPNTPTLAFTSLKTEELPTTYLSRYGRFRTVSIGGYNDTEIVEGSIASDDIRRKISNIVSNVEQRGSVSPFHLGPTRTIAGGALTCSSTIAASMEHHRSRDDIATTYQGISVVTPNVTLKKVIKLDSKRTNKWLQQKPNYMEQPNTLKDYQSMIRSHASCDEADKDSDDEVEVHQNIVDLTKPPCVKSPSRKISNADDDRMNTNSIAKPKRFSISSDSPTTMEGIIVEGDALPTSSSSSSESKNWTSTTYSPHMYVGDKVSPNVKVRDVLRKKFSWKSFPELETYLIDHRKQYLQCSNAMNYTKAQKHYNNELTKGLLQLAADEGYLFEKFTFAAVRDRIRCFYKSFVQATKKKKRQVLHQHHFSYKNTGSSKTTATIATKTNHYHCRDDDDDEDDDDDN